MARTTIAPIAGPGPYATSGVEIQAAATAADVANGNTTPHGGRGLLLIAFNTDGANPHHVTVTSTPDERGRTGDVTADTVAASSAKVYGPFPTNGWKQATDGGLYFSADSATVHFAVIQLDQRGL